MLFDYFLYHAAKSVPIVLWFALAGFIGNRVAGLRGAFVGGGLAAWPLICGSVYQQAENPSSELAGRFILVTAITTFIVFYLAEREIAKQLTKRPVTGNIIGALWVLAALMLSAAASAAISMRTYRLPLTNPITEALLWGAALITLVAACVAFWRRGHAASDVDQHLAVNRTEKDDSLTSTVENCAAANAKKANPWKIIRPPR